MTQPPSLLVCETHEPVRQQLTRRFQSAGFQVRACDSAQHALRMLERQRFDALLTGLMLRDQDAVTFVRELDILGIRLPTVISSFQTTLPAPNRIDPDEPDWVRKAAEQARVIFTLKASFRYSDRLRPRILHIEPDAFSASLVRAALEKHADIRQPAADALPEATSTAAGCDLVILTPVDENPERLEGIFHRLAADSPNTPLLLHARYILHAQGRLLPEACDLGLHGLDLVEVVNTLILHGREAPLCAQA